jgi:hypothetical protein
MTISLEFDDYSPVNNNLGLLEKVHEHYPGCKITLLTVPWEVRFGEQALLTLPQYKPLVNATKKYIKEGWVEIGMHGLTHSPREFETNLRKDLSDLDFFAFRIMAGQRIFEKVGLPYKKIFLAPFWQICEAARTAAQKLGFRLIEEKDFNWNLRDEMPKKLKTVKGHGHIQNTCQNGLEESMPKIMSIPTGARWGFLSELLEDK